MAKHVLIKLCTMYILPFIAAFVKDVQRYVQLRAQLYRQADLHKHGENMSELGYSECVSINAQNKLSQFQNQATGKIIKMIILYSFILRDFNF